MLKITVELLSARDGSIRTLSIMTIGNDGTGTPTYGNYVAKLYTSKRRLYRRGCVKHFPRRRSVWRLVKLALDATLRDGSGQDEEDNLQMDEEKDLGDGGLGSGKWLE